MFEKVLVPLDGSDLAEGILPYVSQLAYQLGSKLLLLSVVDPQEGSETAGFTLRRRLEEIEQLLTEQHLDGPPMVAYGDPAVQIMRVADIEECDLIAIVTHDHRRVEGSVADTLIRSSSKPVLVIPANLAGTLNTALVP